MRLDPLVSAWDERPLAEQAYPFVLVDALVVKVRDDERVIRIFLPQPRLPRAPPGRGAHGAARAMDDWPPLAIST